MSTLGEMASEDGAAEVFLQLKKLFLTQQSQKLGLADLAGFSDEELDACYAMACQKIAVGDLDEALKLFIMLCALRHDRSKYWRGLGLTFHRRKTYEPANMFYGLALSWDPDDVIARVFNAEALLWLNKRAQSQREAERALVDGARLNRLEHRPYLERAKSVLLTIGDDDSKQEFVR